MSPQGSGIETARLQGAGVSVLGRLLWVGTVAGFVIGGLAPLALFAGGELADAVAVFSIGAMLGVVAGVAVQLLNAGVLHVARRAGPERDRAAMRIVLVPLPTVTALVIPLVIITPGPGRSVLAAAWLPALMAGTLGAVAAWLFAPWCLAPIPRRDEAAT